MNVRNLLDSGANVQIVINAADLKELFEEISAEQCAMMAEKNSRESEDTTVTPKDAASMMNVTKTTLWRWKKSGYLVPIYIGRRTYYRKSDIDRITQRR